MVRRFYISIVILVCVTVSAIAQTETKSDTIIPKLLDSVTIKAYLGQISMRPLPSVQGTYIFSGKKTEVIDLQQTVVTLAEKTGRHVFEKYPVYLFMIWMVPATR